MLCSACHTQNPADSRFCAQCGAKLETTCPSCKAAVTADDRFCRQCGHALGPKQDEQPQVPSALAEKMRQGAENVSTEPRTVTILFVDTVNSVHGAQGLDLETLHRVVQERTQIMADAVYQFEGTVLQFLGDGIMAVFGAPVAHEDNGRRAVAAALEMQQKLQAHAEQQRTADAPAFDYRIGLNTGPVIVGNVGDDLSMDYLAIGDTVNLAARMEQSAPPGSIYVTAETYRHAGGYFEFNDLGAISVKGKAEGVHAYEVVRDMGARTRFEVSMQRGLTPLAGRDSELAMLRSYFDQARDGAGQVVSIVGEAGIGKSRLLLEFRERLEHDSHQWFQGQCTPFGSTIPYLAVTDLLRSGFGIDDDDDEERIIAKIELAATLWDETGRNALPYIRYLLSVDPGDDAVADMQAIERRAGILEALRATITQSRDGLPQVLVIEDLHWIDERSDEAIGALVESIEALPVLLLLTYRPGYASRPEERGYVSRIGLRTLSHDFCAEIARGVLNCEEPPEELCSHLMAKAGGNPFFIEEVLRHLSETGVLQQQGDTFVLTKPSALDDIPGTVQDVIRARMDRLHTNSRETLQLAAVVGREFTTRLLARITQIGGDVSEELAILRQAELILRTQDFPEVGYMFKHALTCDVAYESLLSERRRTLHRIIASAVEELYADRLTEHYGMLAHHWYAGHDWPKALEYLELVMHQAAAHDAMQDVLAHGQRALEVSEQLGDVEYHRICTIHERMALASWNTSDLERAAQHFGLSRDVARKAGDEAREGAALSEMAEAVLWAHDWNGAERLMIEIHNLADERQDERLRGRALSVEGELQCIRGGAPAAVETLSEALPRCADDEVWHARVTAYRQFCLIWRGQYDEVLAHYDSPDNPVDVITDFIGASFVGWSACLARAASGRYQEALEQLHKMRTRCQRLGEQAFQSRIVNSIGWIHNEFHDWERGTDFNEQGLALGVALNNHEIIGNARINIGDAQFIKGEFEAARRTLESLYEDLPKYHRWMRWRYSQHAFHSLGRTMMALGEHDRALALADECLALATETESRKNIIKAKRLRGQLFAIEGAAEEAQTEYNEALAVAREIGNPPQLWKTLRAQADLLTQQGHKQEARASVAEALEIVDRVSESTSDTKLRSCLRASTDATVLRDAAVAIGA